MTVHTPSPADLREPPPPTRRVLLVGLVGVALAVAAVAVGLATGAPLRGFEPHPADGPRALLAALGLLVAGCAVSMRPGWFGGWLCGAAAGLIGYGFGAAPPDGTEWYLSPPRNWYAGVPNAWDSVQLFFGVAGVIGLIGAAWTVLPRKAVFALILARGGLPLRRHPVGHHVPGPDAVPDRPVLAAGGPAVPAVRLHEQRLPVLLPDPGPACQLWVCVQYKPAGAPDNDPDVPKECAWAYVPDPGRTLQGPARAVLLPPAVSDREHRPVPAGRVLPAPGRAGPGRAAAAGRRAHPPVRPAGRPADRPGGPGHPAGAAVVRPAPGPGERPAGQGGDRGEDLPDPAHDHHPGPVRRVRLDDELAGGPVGGRTTPPCTCRTTRASSTRPGT